MKTYEQKKYKRKLTLGQYLYKEILDLSWSSRGELWQKLDSDTLEMWIQQYKIKEGHSEWSEKYQKNIWIVDED
jgi:hypothetical protein|tara:strand:- start:412 stop:633 length:222 start_codon:yes stop_codon:yes gene_type:complete